MRWGFIGTGQHAEQVVAPALANAAGQHFAGALGSSLAKGRAFTDKFGGTAYGDLDAMLADPGVDAVFISTPNHLHRDQTLRAAAAGKHVLVEKPMALSAADCEAMIGACSRAGVTLGIGFQRRLHPVAQEVKRLIDAGEIGDIVAMHATFHTSYPAWTNWRGDAARAGSDILAAVGVHLFDLLCWLAGGEPTDVASLVDVSDETGLDQTIAASLRFGGGTMASATITRRARAQFNGLWVHGTRGMAGGPAVLGANSNGTFASRIGDRNAESVFPMPDLFVLQFDAFARAALEGGTPAASGEDGLISVRLSERILEGR